MITTSPGTLTAPFPVLPKSFEDTKVAFGAQSNAQIRKTYWLFRSMNSSFLVQYGTKMLKLALDLKLPIKWAIKQTVFQHFCGGEDIVGCQATINRLAMYHIGTILDYSVEGAKTEAYFDNTCAETIATINKAKNNPNIPFCVFKVTGLAAFNLLEKIQAKDTLTTDEAESWERAQARIKSISLTAYNNSVRLFFDGEETWVQDVIDAQAEAMMALYNHKQCIIFNTYQMYRTASLKNLKDATERAKNGNYYFGAKLVRGAYMEKERKRAASLGYQDPIQPNKAASDHDYDAAMLFCLNHLDTISFCAGTHNEASSLLLANQMRDLGIAPDDKRIWFSQLLGMSDNISYTLAGLGFNVAKYVPYGPVEAVMPYLIRRAQENTSVAGQSSRELLLIAAEMKRRKM